VGMRVKHMNSVAHAQGYYYKSLGSLAYSRDPCNTRRLFTLALERFEQALDTDPNNANTLCHMAEVFEILSEEEEQYNVSLVRLNLDSPKSRLANNYYLRAIAAKPQDSYTLFRYAHFLEKCQRSEGAEDYYLRSLEADPNNSACLVEFGNFLAERNLAADAERLYRRAAAASLLPDVSSRPVSGVALK